MKEILKKGTAKATEAAAPKKEKRTTAASVVLGLLRSKVAPTDDVIIQTVLETVEGSKFNKAQLAWYKHQYKTGRWDDGEAQVINQAKAPRAEKAATPKAAKKGAKKVAKTAKAAVETEDYEEVEA